MPSTSWAEGCAVPEQVVVHPLPAAPGVLYPRDPWGLRLSESPLCVPESMYLFSMCSEHFTGIRFVLVIGGVPSPATRGLGGEACCWFPGGLAQPQALSGMCVCGGALGRSPGFPHQVLAIK